MGKVKDLIQDKLDAELDVLENFINYYTSYQDERDEMMDVAREWVEVGLEEKRHNEYLIRQRETMERKKREWEDQQSRSDRCTDTMEMNI